MDSIDQLLNTIPDKSRDQSHGKSHGKLQHDRHLHPDHSGGNPQASDNASEPKANDRPNLENSTSSQDFHASAQVSPAQTRSVNDLLAHLPGHHSSPLNSTRHSARDSARHSANQSPQPTDQSVQHTQESPQESEPIDASTRSHTSRTSTSSVQKPKTIDSLIPGKKRSSILPVATSTDQSEIARQYGLTNSNHPPTATQQTAAQTYLARTTTQPITTTFPTTQITAQEPTVLADLKAEYEEQVRLAQVEQQRQLEQEHLEQERLEQERQRQLKVQRQEQERLEQQRRLALERQAYAWLEQLDPLSGEGLWFGRFAENYPSQVEAAIDYLAAEQN